MLVNARFFRSWDSPLRWPTHLPRGGVDLNTIRAWLGPVKLDTTHFIEMVHLGSRKEVNRRGHYRHNGRLLHRRTQPRILGRRA